MTFDPTPIKLNQHVFWDTKYRHPQLGIEVGREFFDRVTESSYAMEALTGDNRCPVVLLGERRMGKTSLFRHLIERIKATPGFAPAQLPTGGSLRSVDDLFSEMMDQAAAVLESGEGDIPEYESDLSIEQQLDALERLCAGTPGVTVVLCLDELDVCLEHQETPPAQRAKIAALIDGLAQRDELPVRLLCTMIRRPERLAAGTLTHLLQRATLIHLPPFSRADLDEMVSDLALAHIGVRLSSGELETMYRESGGWPFFAKLLLVTLGECEPGEQRLNRALELGALHPAVGEAVGHIFRHYFDKNEKSFMIELARQQGLLTREQAIRLGPHVRAAADQLIARHFVELEPDGGYRFRIGLLAPWFRQWSKFEELSETYRLVR